jgi:hypothetical protein
VRVLFCKTASRQISDQDMGFSGLNLAPSFTALLGAAGPPQAPGQDKKDPKGLVFKLTIFMKMARDGILVYQNTETRHSGRNKYETEKLCRQAADWGLNVFSHGGKCRDGG